MTSEVPSILWAVADEPCDTLSRSDEFTILRVASLDEALKELDKALHSNKPISILCFEWPRGLDYRFLEEIAAKAPKLCFVIEGDNDILPSRAARSKLISAQRLVYLEKPVTPSARRSIVRYFAARQVEDEQQIGSQPPARSSDSPAPPDQTRLETLYTTIERLHAAPSLPAGLAATLSEISDFIGARTSSLVVLEGEDTLRVIEAIGPGSDQIIGKTMPLASSHLAKKALVQKEPVLLTDMRSDERFADALGKQLYLPDAALSIPVFTGHHPLAVINFGGEAEVASFSQRNGELIATISAQFAVALEKDSLTNNLRTAMSGSIKALVGAIEAKDPYTRGHSDRVTHYSVLTAIELGLPLNDVEVIKQAAILHDIGKIGIPGEILNKVSTLSDDEINIVQQHPAIGISIVEQIGAMNVTVPIISAHHERPDGTGYPNQLRGDDIPMGARILAVSDAYDAMTSDRPYRQTVSVDEAIAELRKYAGTQFDPQIVEAFCRNIHQWPTENTAFDLLTSFL